MPLLIAALCASSIDAQQSARQGDPPRKENTNYAACHVYVVDVEQGEKLMEEYLALSDPTAEQVKTLTDRYPDAERILGRFDAEIAEEVLTTRTFTLTGTEYVVTASVFPTDEQMATKSGRRDSIGFGIVVSKTRHTNALIAENSAVAEALLEDDELKFRVKTRMKVNERLLIIGLECELGEVRPKGPDK